MDFQHDAEMSISREEFFRLLPAAVGSFEVDGDAFRPPGGSGTWCVRLTRLTDHRVGSVAVPRHRVEIVLKGCAAREANAFMERFHRAYLRGGG